MERAETQIRELAITIACATWPAVRREVILDELAPSSHAKSLRPSVL